MLAQLIVAAKIEQAHAALEEKVVFAPVTVGRFRGAPFGGVGVQSIFRQTLTEVSIPRTVTNRF